VRHSDCAFIHNFPSAACEQCDVRLMIFPRRNPLQRFPERSISIICTTILSATKLLKKKYSLSFWGSSP